jgi:hypothetical protein
MLRYALGNPYARIAAVSSWYACVIQFGAESSRCQTVALEVIDLPVVWSAEFILTILGILAFIFEAVRKYHPTYLKLSLGPGCSLGGN